MQTARALQAVNVGLQLAALGLIAAIYAKSATQAERLHALELQVEQGDGRGAEGDLNQVDPVLPPEPQEREDAISERPQMVPLRRPWFAVGVVVEPQLPLEPSQGARHA